eukprot:m.13992 g.13992  ORF g.13992 m.13992 type:complete len:653 (-) comp3341_c0_seq1:2547-4505(-)
MGLLSEGTPLHWDDAKKTADEVRRRGIEQLIFTFERLRGRACDILRWGDEIEYQVVHFDDDAKTAQLAIHERSILTTLNELNEDIDSATGLRVIWHPEYASYMLESTPAEPYGGRLSDFLIVEENMRERRRQAAQVLCPAQRLMALTAFPRLGCPNFTHPSYPPAVDGDISKSMFFPDEAINQHPRFKTLTANIRRRRGRKVAINVPVYHDEKTPKPFVEDFSGVYVGSSEGAAAAKPDHIYLDAMGFGMGCCCLQVTFQACSLEEARLLYDQLAPVCPIVLALSACAPIFRGRLADRDCRWDVISGSVDDRTREEMGEGPLKNDRFRIPKSRYDSIDCYISDSPMMNERYNDVPIVVDEAIKKRLREAGFDELLAQHFAHLFIRDPLVVFNEKLEAKDDENSTDHFENIQSTNWQTMRFKPPPPGSEIGWRVEFRPTEVQLTDFENAAFTVFIVLLTRVILSFNLNLYMPISEVEMNMKNAQKRDAVLHQDFYFRRNLSGVMPDTPLSEGMSTPAPVPDGPDSELMSINTIINGKEGVFVGLVPLIKIYVRNINPDLKTRSVIHRYLNFISERASGKAKTGARWMRDFVTSHPAYKHDSVVSEEINFDLLAAAAKIGEGTMHCPDLIGSCSSCSAPTSRAPSPPPTRSEYV